MEQARDWTSLGQYLDSFLVNSSEISRVECCGSSRWLYCTECFRLLLPTTDLPPSLCRGTFQLPFDLDVLLYDRRKSSTGIHALVVDKLRQEDPRDNVSTRVSLIDIDRDDPIPDYVDQENVYLLFPSNDSVPVSSVASEISKLVVLDVKWTRTSLRLHPSVAALKTVHLSSPPPESYYWRWHNAGKGMLSTIEAVYVAASEVNIDADYLPLLWLFGLQRAMIAAKEQEHGRAAPFTDRAKEAQRQLRIGSGSSGTKEKQPTNTAAKTSSKPNSAKGRGPRKPRWFTQLPSHDM